MDKAFTRAREGQPTLVGITGHDFRDLATEVDHIRELISESVRKYPDVNFKYCEAVEAFRTAIWPDGIQDDALVLDLKFHPGSYEDDPFLEVITRPITTIEPRIMIRQAESDKGFGKIDSIGVIKAHGIIIGSFRCSTGAKGIAGSTVALVPHGADVGMAVIIAPIKRCGKSITEMFRHRTYVIRHRKNTWDNGADIDP